MIGRQNVCILSARISLRSISKVTNSVFSCKHGYMVWNDSPFTLQGKIINCAYSLLDETLQIYLLFAGHYLLSNFQQQK